MLFAVLPYIPTDAGHRALVEEVSRVLRPGGVPFLSDFWLQQDARNRARYERNRTKYGT